VEAEEGGAGGVVTSGDVPAPGPIATVGSSPSGVAATPNIGHEERGGAPGDPQTEAENPLDDEK